MHAQSASLQRAGGPAAKVELGPPGAAAPIIAEYGQRSGEFPDFLANHLPMVLEAMARLGASSTRLAEYARTYTLEHRVPFPPPGVGPIRAGNWQQHLGNRSREADYRAFFAGEVALLGADAAIRHYMPVLANGVAASATHGLMRLGYASLRADDVEVGIALGYWAATYLALPLPADNGRSGRREPLELVVAMRPIEAFRHVEPNSHLLWRWIEAMGSLPEFQALLGQVRADPGLLEDMRRASLALYAATMSFEALHALTGCHWLRLVSPHVDEPAMLAARFWEVVMALYAKIGMPELPSAEQLDVWRHSPVPPDAEIAAAAVASDDEHDHSLVFSALEEFKVYGDPLYRVVAARRVGLI
ncbi:MAG: questin oxidase family protein [Devosia sp.]|nr:questin oxidase family protein [Devosia sp.]